MIDTVAAKYGMLPSEFLARGSTIDIQIHIMSETYKERLSRKQNGGDVSSTYTQSEINEVYQAWQASQR